MVHVGKISVFQRRLGMRFSPDW